MLRSLVCAIRYQVSKMFTRALLFPWKRSRSPSSSSSSASLRDPSPLGKWISFHVVKTCLHFGAEPALEQPFSSLPRNVPYSVICGAFGNNLVSKVGLCGTRVCGSKRYFRSQWGRWQTIFIPCYYRTTKVKGRFATRRMEACA